MTSLPNKKSIPEQTEAPQKYLRPQQKRVRQGESDSAVYIYIFVCLGVHWKVVKKRNQNGSHNIHTADLDSPRREFSLRGLGFFVALSVRSGIDFFVCVY